MFRVLCSPRKNQNRGRSQRQRRSKGRREVSKDVDVGGKFESTKPLKFSKIDVGGLATLVEGGEGGDVDVGGKFESRADLSFNSLDVGGMASINGNGKGVDVDVGGLLRVSGSLTLEKDLDRKSIRLN